MKLLHCFYRGSFTLFLSSPCSAFIFLFKNMNNKYRSCWHLFCLCFLELLKFLLKEYNSILVLKKNGFACIIFKEIAYLLFARFFPIRFPIRCKWLTISRAPRFYIFLKCNGELFSLVPGVWPLSWNIWRYFAIKQEINNNIQATIITQLWNI